MPELKAGVTDAAVEKHVPVYTLDGNLVHVVLEKSNIQCLKNTLLKGGFNNEICM